MRVTMGSDVDSYRISPHKQPPVIVIALPRNSIRPRHLVLTVKVSQSTVAGQKSHRVTDVRTIFGKADGETWRLITVESNHMLITQTKLLGARFWLLPFLACLALVDRGLSAPSGGDSIISQMHARYQKDWYDTMVFSQKNTTYNADGTSKIEMWYERGLLPGKLRIDVGAPADGNAMIMNDGQLYTFQHGTRADSRPLRSLALLLGFDVYRQPPEVTLAQLKHEGIDTSKMHRDTWQGEAVYVVGADKGDVSSKQFWVEVRRLLCVRVIQPDTRKPGSLADIRFLDYRQQPRGWIAARIEVRHDDQLVFSEEYSNIATGQPLDAALFDPEHFQPSTASP
jgi:hypothetical protein